MIQRQIHAYVGFEGRSRPYEYSQVLGGVETFPGGVGGYRKVTKFKLSYFNFRWLML